MQVWGEWGGRRRRIGIIVSQTQQSNRKKAGEPVETKFRNILKIKNLSLLVKTSGKNNTNHFHAEHTNHYEISTNNGPILQVRKPRQNEANECPNEQQFGRAYTPIQCLKSLLQKDLEFVESATWIHILTPPLFELEAVPGPSYLKYPRVAVSTLAQRAPTVLPGTEKMLMNAGFPAKMP